MMVMRIAMESSVIDDICETVDCDDSDILLGDINNDADCDGIPTIEDCNDNLSQDADCDGVTTELDLMTTTHLTAALTDTDCDGVVIDDDCDDSSSRCSEILIKIGTVMDMFSLM